MLTAQMEFPITILLSDNHLSSLPAWQQVIFPQLMYGTILLGFGAWGLDAANRRRGSNVAADAHKNPLGMTYHCVIASFVPAGFFEWAFAFLKVALYRWSFGLELAQPKFISIPSLNKMYGTWEVLGDDRDFFPSYLLILPYTKRT
jgi:hypothetical protein